MVDVLATCLPKIKTDWSKWRIFFCDERIVEPNDERSNFALYKSNFINKVPVTEEQFIQVDPKLSGMQSPAYFISICIQLCIYRVSHLLNHSYISSFIYLLLLKTWKTVQQGLLSNVKIRRNQKPCRYTKQNGLNNEVIFY